MGLGEGAGLGLMVGVAAVFCAMHETEARISAPATAARLIK